MTSVLEVCSTAPAITLALNLTYALNDCLIYMQA